MSAAEVLYTHGVAKKKNEFNKALKQTPVAGLLRKTKDKSNT